MQDAIIEMRGITKRFPGIIANDDINFTVNKGEIHALLGENGAGKSTLMSILSGLYHPDEGEIFLKGKRVAFSTPKDAIDAGIGMIHQHFKLVDTLTVAESIVLGIQSVPLFINKKKIEEEAGRFAENYGMEIDPAAKIWQLSVGEQQRVEILKILYRKAQIIVLDEPTAVLTPQEAGQLFEILKTMTKKGCTVIIITHKLAEVCEIADKVTVLRRGKTVGTVDEDDINYRKLSEMMIGAQSEQKNLQPVKRSEQAVMKCSHLNAKNERGITALDDLTFELYGGEILGVAGVSGNGQRELADILAGVRRPLTGGISLYSDGQYLDVTGVKAKDLIKHGVAYVPEDRLGTGLVPNMNIPDNLMLKNYDSTSGLFLVKKDYDKQAKEVVARYDVSVADIKAPVRLMSGGNLQKVLLAREISAGPKVMIAAYPTRGLDIGAANRIFDMLLQLRDAGCAVLMIAEDLEMIMHYSDRIMVMYRGRNIGILDQKDADETKLGMMMLGTKIEEVDVYEQFTHF